MATQIIRLGNGDSVQVRSGILRGSGPPGPEGPANSLTIGTVTEDTVADATISGTPPYQTLDLVLPTSTVEGPMGVIQDYLTQARLTNSTGLTSGAETLLSFDTVDVDELSMVLNSTTFDPVPSGQDDRVMSFTVSVTFTNPAATGVGYRKLTVKNDSAVVIDSMTVPAVTTSSGVTQIVMPVIARFNANTNFRVYVTHTQGTSLNVTAAKVTCIRVGTGPTGPEGPTGPANALNIGTVATLNTGAAATATITGSYPNQALNLGLPQGDTGPVGGASSGFGRIADLDGTGGNP